MNALTKPKPTLTLNQALSFLEGLVFEAVDEFTKQRKSIDAFDIACHVEHFAKARIVQYVKDRVDWLTVVYEDLLMSREEIRLCYSDPSQFVGVVDAVLFAHFKNLVEWEGDIMRILLRSHYIKGDDDEHMQVVRYRLPKLG